MVEGNSRMKRTTSDQGSNRKHRPALDIQARLEELFSERPCFHQGETEISGRFPAERSFLGGGLKERLLRRDEMCYGILEDTGRFIIEKVGPGNRTLEIGAGLSTLIFAMRSGKHVAITPNVQEIRRIRDYARKKGMSLKNVKFLPRASEDVLPRVRFKNLDFVFIDGKHTFPWPILDWFYVSEWLRPGGILLVDDAQIRAVRILIDFLRADEGWRTVYTYKNKIYGFKKEYSGSMKEVAWHMQKYNKDRSLIRRFKAGLKSVLRAGRFA
jgi:hypothetical protein